MVISNIYASELAESKITPACNTLTVVGSDQWIPFAYTEDSTEGYKAKGIAFDTAKLILGDLGLKADIKMNIPWKRLELMMNEGKADLLAGHYWTKERAQKWYISSEFALDEVRVFVNETENIAFQSLEDLIDYRGLMPKGVSLGPTFDTFRHKLRIDEVQEHDQMIAMLNLKRADYIVLPYFNGQRKINKLNLGEKISALEPALSINKVHLALSRQSACGSLSLLEKINQAINIRLKDGSIKKIEHAYMNSP